MTIVWSILCIIAGIMMGRKPEQIWEIQHWFSVQNGEPTKIYIKIVRCCGIFATAFGVVALRYAIGI